MVGWFPGKDVNMGVEQNPRCYVNVVMQQRNEISFKTVAH